MNDLLTSFSVDTCGASGCDIVAPPLALPSPNGSGSLSPRAMAAFPEEWFFDWRGGPSEPLGPSPRRALSHCPVWQAVNIIAGDLGQLPMRVQRREPATGATKDAPARGERLVATPEHPVDWIINDEPNGVQSPSVFRETLMAWALLWGNGIALVERDARGVPLALHPLPPDRTMPVLLEGGGYGIRHTPVAGPAFLLYPADVVHIRGLAIDGFWGRSCIDVAREAIESGLAVRDQVSGSFRNGCRPGGVLSVAETLSDGARASLRAEWEAIHRGGKNSGRIAVLVGGATYTPVAMTTAESQAVEMMRLDREFVASLFNLPAFKLNALENAAVRANVEEQGREYYATTLSRWANRFAEELKRKLFPEAERRRRMWEVRIDAEALTAGSPDARMARAATGVQHRLITRNEGRALLGYNPVDGGDEFENPNIDTVGDAVRKEARKAAQESSTGLQDDGKGSTG
ncbi:MAG: phage portal protein [Lacipirellulaceae bacterium]